MRVETDSVSVITEGESCHLAFNEKDMWKSSEKGKAEKWDFISKLLGRTDSEANAIRDPR